MTIRVAINGFGRIGRLVLRAFAESGRRDMEIVAINNRSEIDMARHLFTYDSVHGIYRRGVEVRGDTLDVGSGPIRYLREQTPGALPWGELKIDVVLECTGAFNSRAKAAAHLDAGARKVLVSAPAKGADYTVVYGVNHQGLTSEHAVVSNASCTTNCLAPVAKVLHRLCGIERGYMTTIHAYTTDQRLLDNSHKKDLRRARAAGMSMVPTSTGAADAVGEVMPELRGRLAGAAVRVPVPNVSFVDLVFTPGRPVTEEEVNAAMVEAAGNDMNGVIAICDEPLVSIDFNHHPASAIFDVTQTRVIDGALVHVAAWYDNEWGFSHRMNDTAVLMGAL